MDILKQEKIDWLSIRKEIFSVRFNHNRKNPIWDKAIDLFETSIENKYLFPLDHVQVNGDEDGEGYSIISIISILIEVLASYRYGQIFQRDPVEEYEYNDSKNLYKGFLKDIPDFKRSFEGIKLRSEYDVENFDCYLDFYWNVRCSLLHGGQLRNNWIISSYESNDKNDIIFIKERGDKKVIYRNILINVINSYFTDYITILRNDNRGYDIFRQQFGRRMDWHFEITTYKSW
ncbi:MAG: hypothetical protein WCJ61_11350 [Paludibacter sp.]